MADYIDREAFIEHIEKDPLYPLIEKYGIKSVIEAFTAADVVDGALFRDCRNELCLKCGEYRLRYKGACDGCRWMEVEP